jgi:hypothetical protein
MKIGNRARAMQGTALDDDADEAVLRVIGSLPPFRSLKEQLALLRITLSILEAYADIPDCGSLALTPEGALFRVRHSVLGSEKHG